MTVFKIREGPIPGRTALRRWTLGLLILVCVLAIANVHRRPISYALADGAADAIRQSAVDDTRYLAVKGEYPNVLLPSNLSFSPEEPLKAGRDVRLIPAAPADLYDKQRTYLLRYNGMMLELLRAKQQRGQPVHRLEPLSATTFGIASILVVAPLFLHVYLQYRLGPYRLDGRLWTYNLWSDISWEYMQPSTYADGAQLLLLMLWIDTALIVPWALVTLSAIRHRPLP